MKRYSVLLKYIDAFTDGNFETYYTQIWAENPQHAIAVAKADAVTAQEIEAGYELDDFAAVLVIAGHHEDLTYAVDNKE